MPQTSKRTSQPCRYMMLKTSCRSASTKLSNGAKKWKLNRSYDMCINMPFINFLRPPPPTVALPSRLPYYRSQQLSRPVVRSACHMDETHHRNGYRIKQNKEPMSIPLETHTQRLASLPYPATRIAHSKQNRLRPSRVRYSCKN
jgi:hypothetical protein